MPACGPFVDWRPRRVRRGRRVRVKAPPHPTSPPAAERDVRLRPREDMDMDRHLGRCGGVDSGLRDARLVSGRPAGQLTTYSSSLIILLFC